MQKTTQPDKMSYVLQSQVSSILLLENKQLLSFAFVQETCCWWLKGLVRGHANPAEASKW